jgi:drug/metabolite transporter (DMT)-like permease
LIKVAVAEIPPLAVAWCRVALGVCALIPIAWHRGALRPAKRHVWPLIALAFAEFAIPFATISLGEQWISSSLTGILIATVPLWVVLLSRAFGVHEPLGLKRAGGLALGFVGVVTLLGFGTVAGILGWLGVLCVLIAALGYAVGPLVIQRYLTELDPLGPVTASLVIAAVVLFVPALAVFPSHWPSAPAIWAVVVLGVVCSALAMLLMFYLVNRAGASRATLITYVNPAVASLLGVGLLHETLGPTGLSAFGMIIAGSWLASRSGVKRVEEVRPGG